MILRPYISSMAYIPHSMLGAERLSWCRKQLTVKPRTYADKPPPSPIITYDENVEGYLGVPINWALLNFPNIQFDDHTVLGGESYFRSLPSPEHELATVGQKEFMDSVELATRDYFTVFANAKCGSGKCHRAGTPIIKYDGSIVSVENLKVGDLLMGPDSEPRCITSICQGRGKMYQINPIRGDSWGCNEEHILTLVHYGANREPIDISLKEFLKKSNTFQRNHKLFQPENGVDFVEGNDPTINPYFLGVWVGDGSKNLNSVSITKPDRVIAAICEEVSESYGLLMRTYFDKRSGCPTYTISSGTTHRNELLEDLRRLMWGKEIPLSVCASSRFYRQQFLAGVIDTDGYVYSGCCELTQKNKNYAEGIAFIARSLGLKVVSSVKEVNGQSYQRLSISGDFSSVPTRIPRKQFAVRHQRKTATRTGFTVEAKGEGDYYGFTLGDSPICDGRYLLGDFTVTHNTVVSLRAAALLGRRTLIIVQSNTLAHQWKKEIVKQLGVDPQDVGTIQQDKCEFEKPWVVAIAHSLSLRKYPADCYTAFGTVIWEEVHRLGAPFFAESVRLFPARVKVALSASTTRKDQCERVFIDYFGSPVAVSTQEVMPVRVHAFKIPCRLPSYVSHHGHMVQLLAEDHSRNLFIVKIIKQCWARGCNMLIIGDKVEHLQTLIDMCTRSGVAARDCGLFVDHRYSGQTRPKFSKVMRQPRIRDILVYWKSMDGSSEFPQYTRVQVVGHSNSREVVEVAAGGRTVSVHIDELRQLPIEVPDKIKVTKEELDVIGRTRQLIFAVYGIFKEGIDIPRLDTGIDVTPRADAEQVIGRIRRVVPGKLCPVRWYTIIDRSPKLEGYWRARLKDYRNCGAEILVHE